MGARVRRGVQFRELLLSEIDTVIREACLSVEDETIARAYYVKHDAQEDIAAETMFSRATVSRRITRIVRRMENAAKRLGLLHN